MFASLKKLFARMNSSRTTPARPRPAALAVESLEAREVPAGLSTDWAGVGPEPQPDSPAAFSHGYDLKLNR